MSGIGGEPDSPDRRAMFDQVMKLLEGRSTKFASAVLCDAMAVVIGTMADDVADARKGVVSFSTDLTRTIETNWTHFRVLRRQWTSGRHR